MTLKQKLFLKKLPENNYNISKTAKQVGYSDRTAVSTVYTQIKNSKSLQEKIKEIYEPEKIKFRIEQARKRFKKDKDSSSECRMIELEAKIAIPELRKQEIINSSPDKIIIVNKLNQSSDEKTIPPVVDEDLKKSSSSLAS
jgi:hypothetical protein